MRNKIKVIVGFMLISALIITGCGSSEQKNETSSVKELTANIKDKYSKQENYEYTDPIYDVNRDHGFTFTLMFDPSTVGENWNNIFEIYSDAEFKEKVAYMPDWDKNGDWSKGNEVTLTPFRNAKFAVPDEKFGGYLFDKGEFQDWGNAQQYYILQKYDLKTGEKLAKPLVTSFTVDTEIEDAPDVQFYISDDGIAGLKWDKVKGAKEYLILEYETNNANPSSNPYVSILAKTDKLSWEDSNKDDPSKNNWNFRTVFGKSADDVYKELKDKLDTGEIDKEQFAKQTNYVGESQTSLESTKYLAVIAINKKGTSKISNAINIRSIAPQVPVRAANYMNEGSIQPSGDSSKTKVDRQLSLVSSYAWVVMGDGSVTQKLVHYDTSDVKETRETISYFESDENGNMKLDANGKPILEKTESIPILSIPYTIDKTAIKGYAQITNYDKDSYKKELSALKKRQEGLQDKTGDVKKAIDLNAKSSDDDSASELNRKDFKVFASSALSEYLAIQMLNGETKVNLDAFKESSSQEYLVDAWYEAMYQNPLTLGVRGISLDRKGNNLLISYDQDKSSLQTKQQEIQTKVSEITKDIIKENMSDMEKEEAINNYLMEHASYDEDALANAEKNNFAKVDDKFNDSFTAYGILINNKGVCAGYAAAFKLLADEAGLESIVVTGYLDGSLPHAWNRVKIDGEWLSLDTTNNDNEFIPNAMFNIPDTYSQKVLVEDDLYMLNSQLTKYIGTNENNEYYRYHQKYFSTTEIVSQLVAAINKDGDAVLRTEYNLSEEEFYSIAEQVADATSNPNLKGTYFFGVIRLQK